MYKNLKRKNITVAIFKNKTKKVEKSNTKYIPHFSISSLVKENRYNKKIKLTYFYLTKKKGK